MIDYRKFDIKKCALMVQCVAAIATVALAFALCGMEGGVQLSLSLTSAAAIAIYIYRHWLHGSDAGAIVLTITAFVVSGGVILNVYCFTTELGGTLDAPVLLNSDAMRYFKAAENIYSHNYENAHGTFVGVPIFTVALWTFFGKSIVFPLAFNMFLTLTSVALGGRLAAVLLHRTSATDATAMALTAAVCHYTGQGMVLLKEPMMYVGFLLTAIPVAHFYRDDRLTAKMWMSLVAGCILSMLVRNPSLHFVSIGLIMFLPLRFSRRRIYTAIVALAIIEGCSLGGTVVSHLEASRQSRIIAGAGKMGEYYLTGDSRYDAYKAIIGGNYYQMPVLRRVALLPVSAAVQYAVPFPWNFSRDTTFGYSQAYNHVAYPWYAIGGIILFYYLLLWRKRSTPLRLWALWMMVCWLIPAYIYCGSVSRYVMQFIPGLVPLAIAVIDKLRVDAGCRKRFRLWVCVYIPLMAVALASCYFVQTR